MAKLKGRGVIEATLSPLQAAFCREYVVCDSGEQAVVKAGYQARPGGSGNPAAVQASRLLKMAKIQAEIAKLRQAAATPAIKRLTGKILSETERKVILSEIARASLSDYVLAGADGDEVSITKDSPNPHALAEVQTRTDYDSDGSRPRVIQRVKLRDPIQAISELNKMEHLYESEKGGTTVNNQVLVVVAGSEEGQAIVKRLMAGEGE